MILICNFYVLIRLFFEIHENFALEVQQMLEGENFSEIKILDDFHEKARIVKAKINL